jgi:DHA1 family tetracycline resistance protein-like MFS transporter
MNRTLAVIFFTVFIDLLGVGLVVPVLPQLLGNPDSPLYLLQHNNAASYGLILHGVLFSIYALAQFIASPVLGQLSDKYGRRKVLIASMALTGVAQAGFALSLSLSSLLFLFITRFITGIASGNIPVAQAIITDTVSEEKRSAALGIIGAAFGLGLIFGPFIGGKLIHVGPAFPFVVSACLALLNAFFIWTTLKETHHVVRSEQKVLRPRLSIRAAFDHVRDAFAHKTFRPVFVVYFLVQLGFAVYMAFATVHFAQRFKMTESGLGLYFALAGLFGVVAQLFVVRFVAKRYSERAAIIPGLALKAIGLAGVALSPTYTVLYISTFVLASGYGLVHANTPAYLSMSVEHNERGMVLGYLGSVMALGLAIPPLLAGVIAMYCSAQTTLLLAALAVGGGAIYLYFAHKHHRFEYE